MANMNITFDEMSSSATRMRSHKTEIDDRLNDSKKIVNMLVESGFSTDTSSDRFRDVHEDFVTAATEVMINLTLLSEWLDKAVAALRDVDTQLTSSLNK